MEGELIESNQKISVSEKSNTMLLPPAHHTYSVFIIQLAVQQVIYAGLSLRGCERNFKLLTQFLTCRPPVLVVFGSGCYVSVCIYSKPSMNTG